MTDNGKAAAPSKEVEPWANLANGMAVQMAELKAQLSIAMDALDILSKVEPCDCGCPSGTKPVAIKPLHSWLIAEDAVTEIRRRQQLNTPSNA